MKQNIERDDFIDGLSLGVWDEEFGYYLPAELANKPKSPEGLDGHVTLENVLTDISIISNVVEVEFGEPDVTSTKDFQSGKW